ncbi:hypothetical protein [Lacipirellula limnantheis]|uniref:Uncharacterized protein n=1 Tax=Lacipirellula limnantheis TaxID=2528024 RepID=A0A517TTI9_9BACT|nr:hypothetical protein [Lacipirellula limnantheis]QDT71684.1 hypothetical protein I41_08440 [Lacipirellula limnantheis]
MLQKQLPEDCETLKHLLQNSQIALDAYCKWCRRTQMSNDIIKEYLSGQSPYEPLVERLNAIGHVDCQALAGELPDCSLLAKYLDPAAWDAAWAKSRAASQIYEEAIAAGLFEDDPPPGGEDALRVAFEMFQQSAEAVVSLLRAFRDQVLESVEAATTTHPQKPEWNDTTLKLHFRGKCVRQLRPDAQKPRAVLQHFQDAQWSEWVELPDTWDDQTVRETVKTLNQGLLSLKFCSANRKEPNNILIPGVEWIVNDRRATPAQAP